MIQTLVDTSSRELFTIEYKLDDTKQLLKGCQEEQKIHGGTNHCLNKMNYTLFRNN